MAGFRPGEGNPASDAAPGASARERFAPVASLDTLRRRAALLAEVRRFFRERDVLEVDTPVLCVAGAVDAHLDPIPVAYRSDDAGLRLCERFLVTSPEHSMKRLLAAGSGPIFQIGHAFRQGERGRRHNPEFTLLEWYRPGFDHRALMDEVEDLMRALLPGDVRFAGGAEQPFERVRYRDAFVRWAGVDPLSSSLAELRVAPEAAGAPPLPADGALDRDGLLDFLLVTVVEPQLGRDRPIFLHDYPASQAALARLCPHDDRVAERFELYVAGTEIANGYHELLDAREQEARFLEANRLRRAAGKDELPIDRRFLAALRAGLPPCAGVAVGLDRVVMLAVGAGSIDEVLPFPFEVA